MTIGQTPPTIEPLLRMNDIVKYIPILFICRYCFLCKDMSTVKVGDRIESDGHYATVRFTGNLQHTGSDILWIGVEWDDPSRGKHDGSFKGVRYFHASHSTAGSFLRREKCNTGVAYMEALTSRYGSVIGDSMAVLEQNLYVCGRNQQTQITAVGLEELTRKQSNFEELRTVSLRGTFVSRVGDVDEIRAKSINLRDLDLSLNMLSSWKDVANIAKNMPKLKLLNISENRLGEPNDQEMNSSFSAVKSLFINHLTYDWQSIFHCLKAFPLLENLHACYNRIENISDVMTLPCSDYLRLINLEGNPIVDWDKIMTLGKLMRLETLILNDCQVAQIHFPGSCTSSTDLFPALISLSICGNQLSDWSSFNHLNRLRSFTTLRFSRNPLPSVSKVLSARYVAVATISRLKHCNGADVSRLERHDAEVSYMITHGAEWKAAKEAGSEHGFYELHPRYQELIRVYGAPEDSEIAPAATSALKNELISVRIESKSTNRPPMIKQLPSKMTIQRLKTLVQRAFGVDDLSALRLIHISIRKNIVSKNNSKSEANLDNSADEKNQQANTDVAKVELDNDLRDLSFYSIEDGAVILAEW